MANPTALRCVLSCEPAAARDGPRSGHIVSGGNRVKLRVARFKCVRPWRNWIAHQSSELRVAGSNPAGRTFDFASSDAMQVGAEPCKSARIWPTVKGLRRCCGFPFAVLFRTSSVQYGAERCPFGASRMAPFAAPLDTTVGTFFGVGPVRSRQPRRFDWGRRLHQRRRCGQRIDCRGLIVQADGCECISLPAMARLVWSEGIGQRGWVAIC